jgi:pimeloyl-ACP methyl ester carboxylesterase
MRRISSRAGSAAKTIVAIAVAALLIEGASGAWAQSGFRHCGLHGRLSCAVVRAPLDASGHVPGTVRLAALRYEPSGDATAGTIVGIAGGPGQSAIEALPGFVSGLGPVLRDRALVVFDERGIGLSGPLSCRSIDTLAACARRLGPTRALYSTVDSVGDLEAIRQALHVDHFALAGVSYGTFLALVYAQAHPQQVDHLLLDSTVPADGETAVGLSTVTAVRGLLSSMCATACPSLNPLQDVQTLLAKLRRRPVHFDNGFSHLMVTATIAGETVYEAVVASDLDPLLRATLPATLHLIAAGDLSALGRLQSLAASSPGFSAKSSRAAAAVTPSLEPQIDVEALATTCEDTRWPWLSTDPLAVRASKARDAFGALPADAIAPFDRKTIFDGTSFTDCERWPEAGSSPARVAAALPPVPTLVLSGRDDVRTPTADASVLAASLPGATLLTVPNVGHAVLSSDPSGCARRALAAFFLDRPIAQCPAAPAPTVDPLPPASASVLPAAALAGTAGRVLSAAVLTLRHDVGFTIPALAAVGETEGTHAGYVVVRGSGRRAQVVLHRLSYIAGVALNGSLTVGNPSPYAPGTLSVSYGGHRYGTLTLGPHGAIRGRLGGHAFSLSLGGRKRINAAGGLSPTPGSAPPVTPPTDKTRGVARGARV